MITKQFELDLPAEQAPIYRLALSLDAFLVNGIQYGVLHRVAPGFLQKTASNLMRDLASLDEQAQQAASDNRPRVVEVLASLKARCQRVVDLVNELSSFRALPLPQLRSLISQIMPLREECVQRIQEVESCLRTEHPFYLSRPSHSTATLNDFLANLERAFLEEWVASNANAEEAPSREQHN